MYTFHSANDHTILGTAETHNEVQQVAQQVAQMVNNGSTAVRLYVHNGVGVVAALLCRNGTAHDILRDDYMRFEAAARTQRTQSGISSY